MTQCLVYHLQRTIGLHKNLQYKNYKIRNKKQLYLYSFLLF